MNKMIKALLLVALVGLSYQQAAIDACGSSNGVTTLGVCQYIEPTAMCLDASQHATKDLCKAGAAATTCLAAPGELIKSNDTDDLACICDGTNTDILQQTNGTYSCGADVANGDAATKCPFGYTNTADGACGVEITAIGCAQASDATTCTKCYNNDGTTFTDATNDACSAITISDTTYDHFIRRVGWFTECPTGYVVTSASDKTCVACDPGCALCAPDAPATCTACASGNIIVSNKCVAVDDTNTCDASCDGCTTYAKNCKACAEGYQPIAAFESAADDTVMICTPAVSGIQGCGTKDAAVTDKDQCSATGCVTGFTWNADTLTCDCATAGEGAQLFTEYVAADATADPAVVESLGGWRCLACADTCDGDAGKECRMSATETNAPTCQDIPGWVPPANCDDEALVKAGCHTCAKATDAAEGDPKVCSKCFADARAAETDGSCKCENKVDQALWTDADGVAKECKTCATPCGEGKFCVIKANGEEDTCSDTQADDSPSGGSGSGASNANILSAALAILAIILA